jgi:hypothetical protein
VRPDDTRLRVLWCDERDLMAIREDVGDWIRAIDDRAHVVFSGRWECDRKKCLVVSFPRSRRVLDGEAIPEGIPK